MAKVGVEFLESNAKRRLDQAAALSVVGASLSPGIITGLVVGGESIRRNPAKLFTAGVAPWLGVAAATCVEQRTLNPIYTQVRKGGNGDTVNVHKLLTCQETEETGIVGGSDVADIKPFAKLVRRFGVDELPQVLDVLTGSTGFFGMRQVMDITLEQRESAASKAGRSALFEDYMYWYERASGLIAPDAIYAHKIRRYDEDGPEAIRLMEIAVSFAQSQSLETTLKFVADLPRMTAMPAEQIYDDYALAA